MKKAFFCIDGFSFRRINDYYKYEHKRHSRLKIASFETYLRYEMERRLGIEGNSESLSFEKHFYHPSQSPHSYFYRKDVRDSILKFESSLVEAGYAVHYSKNLPSSGIKPNENIFMDSMLAMQLKHFDFFILLSTQGDYAKLLRSFKNSRIVSILVGWDAHCTNSYGENRCWRTDKVLLNNASVYCPLDKMLNLPNSKNPLVEIMFEISSPNCPLNSRCG
jgi:hypothetical protein